MLSRVAWFDLDPNLLVAALFALAFLHGALRLARRVRPSCGWCGARLWRRQAEDGGWGLYCPRCVWIGLGREQPRRRRRGDGKSAG